MLSVRLKGSFSLSRLTTFSTNIKTHTEACVYIYTQFTEVVYAGRKNSSDVWKTANPLNNTANTISVLFLTAVEKTTSGLMSKGKGEGKLQIPPKCPM